MVIPEPASIVIINFPFSDLSGSKFRPAVVLAEAGRGDWILCQPSQRKAVRLTDESFDQGSLQTISFARPTKLFTAHTTLMNKRVAVLTDETFKAILATTIDTFQKNLPG